MDKLMLLYRGERHTSYDDFREMMLKEAGRLDRIFQPRGLHMTFTESPPPAASIIPFRRDRIAVLSVYAGLPALDGGAEGYGAFLREPPEKGISLKGVYPVEEALPVKYQVDWSPGETTPGVCLLTLFRRRPGISYEAFIDRWHNSHTPLSLRIHPLWHYNRNVVNPAIMEGSETWEGIVEEHFRTRSSLLNPFRFFGNPLVIVPHMLQVYTDTNAFLDYKTIETYLAREIIFR